MSAFADFFSAQKKQYTEEERGGEEKRKRVKDLAMEYQASSLAFSKKFSNGHSFAGNSIYDGVFATAAPTPSKFTVPNFSSRVEDYREIFGGTEASRGSSIPFLEVPELNERKISVDVRSSKLDYSKIFGGFGDSNFAVPYQEFSSEPNKRKKSEQAQYVSENTVNFYYYYF